MSLEQGSGFRLPRLSSNPTSVVESVETRKPFHSFVTNPSKEMFSRVISDNRKSVVSGMSKFKVGRNPVQLQQPPSQQNRPELSTDELRMRQHLQSQQNEPPVYIDQRPQQLVGTRAVHDFYQHYKKLSRVLEENRLNGLASNSEGYVDSPYTAILENSQKLKVLPACYGMIRGEGARNVLKLGNYKLGDKHSQVLSSGLREMKDVDEYLLSSNRLTDKGFNEVLASVNADAVKLDFSNNRINNICGSLMHLLTNVDSRLLYLNLQNNKLGDTAMSNLALAVSINKTLRYLNLRRNFLTKSSCQNLSTIVEKARSLEQLYLGWNKFNGAGARMVFQRLCKNSTLVVLDYSNNGLGQFPGNSDAVSEFIGKNIKVAHLDLSYNNFPLGDCQQIAESLKMNHTIYGIHFSGNYGYINHQGFLMFDEMGTYDSIPCHPISSLDSCVKRAYGRHDFSIRKDICWLCEGWLEHTIDLPADLSTQKVFALHFSFDGFRKVEYSLKNKDGKLKVMLPPSDVRAYYTVDDVKGTLPNHPVEEISKVELPTCLLQQNLVLSVIKSQGRRIVTDEQYKEISTPIIPRSDGKQPKKKKVWQFKDSVWAKEWKSQDNELTKKCFETDWQNSKIPNLIKNPADQALVKQMMFQNYRNIKEIYRYYAAWSPFGDIWAVALNPFTEFCNQAKLISKELPSKIVDLTFITTNSMSGADWKGNHQVPERGLTRFQFMESLVRLADEKYRKNGIFDQMSECIGALLTDHLKPMYHKFETEQWRSSAYFTEHNDTLIKLYRPVFKEIYRRNSKLKVRPGDKPFMCLEEFKEVCQLAGLFAPGCAVERDCMVNYNVSMMTQVDQLTNQRIFRMTEIEFIEAMARMSQYLTVQTLENGGMLHHRFQQLITELIQRVSSEDIRSQFPPGPSIFQTEPTEID